MSNLEAQTKNAYNYLCNIIKSTGEEGITPEMLIHHITINFGKGEIWINKMVNNLLKVGFVSKKSSGELIWQN